mmetsp:Transcript_29740/g.65904  ORF Transcript_29740/g.65904 Transcript_29740/m.65904 type:complete len:493 (+) Transcript_29740:154-1632(+)
MEKRRTHRGAGRSLEEGVYHLDEDEDDVKKVTQGHWAYIYLVCLALVVLLHLHFGGPCFYTSASAPADLALALKPPRIQHPHWEGWDGGAGATAEPAVKPATTAVKAATEPSATAAIKAAVKPAGTAAGTAAAKAAAKLAAEVLEMEIKKVDLFMQLPMTADPTQLHRQWLMGNGPDYVNSSDLVTDENTCDIFQGDAALLSRISLPPHAPTPAENVAGAGAQDGVEAGAPPRIFCGIYTTQAALTHNALATRNTWAKRCDGFLAFSTADDASFPAVGVVHEGEEEYNNMWQKSRSIWKYIHHHLRDSYDFFLVGGDDMFYIVENLTEYLGSEEIQAKKREGKGLYLGHIFRPASHVAFNSGGAGYILDKAALEILGPALDQSVCQPHRHSFAEDTYLASCLGKKGILPYESRDALGRERFHPFRPSTQLAYQVAKEPKKPDWYARFHPHLKTGFDCCSDQSVSFHYAKETLLYGYYNYVYRCKEKGKGLHL